jgi:membrane protease YdiL (CAAX protease family)
MRIRGRENNVAIAYCFITFAVSWAAWIFAARAGSSLVEFRVFALAVKLTRQGALALLGNIAPGVVAILMLLASGRGLRPLLVQFSLPRCSKVLYLFAITIPIALNLLMLWAEDGVNTSAFDKTQIVTFSKTFLLNLFLTPLWEEIGWRGYLLPMLSKKTHCAVHSPW